MAQILSSSAVKPPRIVTPVSDRRFAADLLFTTITAVGKQISERDAARAEIDHWAEAVATMLSGYLGSLGATKAPVKKKRRARTSTRAARPFSRDAPRDTIAR